MLIQHATTAVASATAAHRVLVIGGAYAGLAALIKLLQYSDGKGTEPKLKKPLHVTLLDSRDGFYHSVGSPLVFAESSFVSKAWRRFTGIKELQRPEVQFIWGKAKLVDTANKTAVYTKGESADEGTIEYDYLVNASGLRRAWPVVPQAVVKDEYLKEVGTYISEIENAKHSIVVVGGGAVGIECAAEFAVLHPSKHTVLVHSRQELLSAEPLPSEFKEKALELLQNSGVEVILGQRVEDKNTRTTDDGYVITLGEGRELRASKIINAVSRSIPSTEFLPKEVLDEEGYVKVLPTLQFLPGTPNSTTHFCIGDPAHVSGIKRAGAAMAMGHQAAQNIYTLLLASEEQAEKSQQQIISTLESPEQAPALIERPEVPPMIALAVGKVAATYSPMEGVNYGEDVMIPYFGTDLGWEICWNWVGLTKTDNEDEF